MLHCMACAPLYQVGLQIATFCRVPPWLCNQSNLSQTTQSASLLSHTSDSTFNGTGPKGSGSGSTPPPCQEHGLHQTGTFLSYVLQVVCLVCCRVPDLAPCT